MFIPKLKLAHLTDFSGSNLLSSEKTLILSHDSNVYCPLCSTRHSGNAPCESNLSISLGENAGRREDQQGGGLRKPLGNVAPNTAASIAMRFCFQAAIHTIIFLSQARALGVKKPNKLQNLSREQLIHARVSYKHESD